MNAHLQQDGFEDYFFHKLRSWIPENYWTQDFKNGSLESLIRAFADEGHGVLWVAHDAGLAERVGAVREVFP